MLDAGAIPSAIVETTSAQEVERALSSGDSFGSDPPELDSITVWGTPEQDGEDPELSALKGRIQVLELAIRQADEEKQLAIARHEQAIAECEANARSHYLHQLSESTEAINKKHSDQMHALQTELRLVEIRRDELFCELSEAQRATSKLQATNEGLRAMVMQVNQELEAARTALSVKQSLHDQTDDLIKQLEQVKKEQVQLLRSEEENKAKLAEYESYNVSGVNVYELKSELSAAQEAADRANMLKAKYAADVTGYAAREATSEARLRTAVTKSHAMQARFTAEMHELKSEYVDACQDRDQAVWEVAQASQAAQHDELLDRLDALKTDNAISIEDAAKAKAPETPPQQPLDTFSFAKHHGTNLKMPKLLMKEGMTATEALETWNQWETQVNTWIQKYVPQGARLMDTVYEETFEVTRRYRDAHRNDRDEIKAPKTWSPTYGMYMPQDLTQWDQSVYAAISSYLLEALPVEAQKEAQNEAKHDGKRATYTMDAMFWAYHHYVPASIGQAIKNECTLTSRIAPQEAHVWIKERKIQLEELEKLKTYREGDDYRLLLTSIREGIRYQYGAEFNHDMMNWSRETVIDEDGKVTCPNEIPQGDTRISRDFFWRYFAQVKKQITNHWGKDFLPPTAKPSAKQKATPEVRGLAVTETTDHNNATKDELCTRSIYVGKLPTANVNLLKELKELVDAKLANCKKPKTVELLAYQNALQPFTFLEFNTPADATTALNKLGGAKLCGQELAITMRRPAAARAKGRGKGYKKDFGDGQQGARSPNTH